MKKRIFFIVIIIVLLAGVTLFIFRHEIIGHALKITIHKKTNETITLNIGDINYSVLNSTVSFCNSKLIFDSTYINKDKTIELSELDFDEIRIENLSILRLIFKREFVAHKFIITKPSLWFSENNNPIHFKEKPKEIVNSLKEKPDLLGELVIILDEFEITNGVIDIKQIINSEEHSGSVEFQLLLSNINTSKENVVIENRLLFAEKHFVKLSNFKYFLPSGDKISFDSSVFETGLNSLVTNNIKVELLSNSIHAKFNPIIAEVHELLIDGIDLEALESMHDINIDSIAITDVNLDITEVDSDILKAISDTSQHKFNPFKVLKSFNLGAFTLNNINLLNHSKDGDTIINLEDLNFVVKDIKLDSTLLANKLPDVDYGSILLSSGVVKVLEKESGLAINLNNFRFTENNGVISIIELQIRDHKAKGSSMFIMDVDSIDIAGVFIKEFVSGKTSKIDILITNPKVDVDLGQSSHSKSEKKDIVFDKFEISNVQITNGLIHLFKKDKLDVVVNGFDFSSGQMHLNNLNKLHEINTDNLTLTTTDFKIHLQKNGLDVTSGSLSFLNNKLEVNNISTNINDKSSINSAVFVKQLQLGDINIGKIITDKKIGLNYIKVIKPRITGKLDLASNKSKNSQNDSSQNISYIVDIDNFQLLNGKVDLELMVKEDDVKIQSGLDIIVDNINIADSKDTTWLSNLLWNIKLSQSTIDYQDYLISCKNIESDKAKKLLSVLDVEIIDNLKSITKSRVDIRKLSIKSVNLSGLEYNTIIKKQTPVVKSIFIDNPYFDLRIDNQNPKRKTEEGGNKKPLPFTVDDFEISNLSFKLEKHDSVSVSNFSLVSLDFKYDMTSVDDIVSGLHYFSATDFLFSDTIKNAFAVVKKLNYNEQLHKISIAGVAGGSINKQLEIDNYLSYQSSGVGISGIEISSTSPYDVGISAIEIDDFVLNIEDKKRVKSKTEEKSKRKIELPKFFNSLIISEITGLNIDISHATVTDTSVNNLTLTKLGLMIDSVRVDSNTFINNDYNFVKTISIKLGDNSFVSSDSLYETSITNVSYNFAENTLEVDSLLMKPRYEWAEFFKKAKFQTGMMDVVAGQIVCSNFRLDKLLDDGSIHLGGVDVYGLDTRIFRNKKYKMNPDKYVKMPQEALLSAPKVITIDSLKTHDAYIKYRQLSEKSVVPGELFLNEVDLTVFNINNDLKVIDQTSVMVANFKGKLIGESNIDMKMTIPILSTANDFWVTGHVEEIDFTKLSSLTQNLVGITMASGTGELDIPLITGNSTSSEGSILFKYKKLKIELYDREKAENASGLGGSMANLLLNDIFIKSKNPGFLGKTRPGEVYFKRDTQKSIVYYTWKSILSGLMSTMGYNNKEQRQEKRALRRKRK